MLKKIFAIYKSIKIERPKKTIMLPLENNKDVVGGLKVLLSTVAVCKKI